MATNRESSDTIEIGRDYEYGPRFPDRTPLRRSSTSRSDEWAYYDSIPGQRDYYDDYRPRHKGPDVYDRPGRQHSNHDNFYYDRWQGDLVPAKHRGGAPNHAVSLRPRARSPSPIGYYDDERIAVAERSKRSAPGTVPRESTDVPRRRRNSEPIPGLFQTIFDVNHPQDTSVHLELHITDDYETELEEFCRLQRLGNFGAAEEYFRNNVEQHLSNPYVFVQYGQMLLEKGDYIAFEQLNAEAVFPKKTIPRSPPLMETVVTERTRSPPPRVRSRARSRSWSPPRERRQQRRREMKARSRSQSPVINGRQERHARFERDVQIVRRRSRSPSVDRPRDHYYSRDLGDVRDRGRSFDGRAELKDMTVEPEFDELELLRQNWRLMKCVCEIHSKGNYEDALAEALYTIENFLFGPGHGSTEIQLAKLTLQLCAQIEHISSEKYYSSGLGSAARDWLEWPTLFKELLVQGRIWDFKDLYVANLAAFSDTEATPFFGTEDQTRSLVDDWISDEGDESTNLALLDILLEPAQLRSVFPDETKSRVQAIINHCPAAMKSRSFIRWILASAADALAGETKGEDGLWMTYKTRINGPQGFPGMVWHRKDCFLPGVYVPPNTENPGWVAPELSVAVDVPIQLALNLAKELKDYRSQAACLKLRIFQSADPTQLFQDLAYLQKSMQGDKEGHLETLLSSYLVCNDRPSKEKLLEELQQTDDWRDDTLSDGMLYWSRDFIERALKRNLQGPKSTAKLRNPPSYYMDKGLPREVEQFTYQNTEHVDLARTTGRRQDLQKRHNGSISSPSPKQAYGQQIIRPDSRPSSPSGRQFLRTGTRPRSPPNRHDDESFTRRERERRELEELEALRKEVQLLQEKEERERRAQDREWRERLEAAKERERRLKDIETAETKMKAAEQQLKQEVKMAKEQQEREARAQQDRDTRERLERAEVSLRDQAERLKRAEDRSHKDWLFERGKRLSEKTRRKRIRSRRKTRVATVSLTSSETYSSDSSRSSDDEDSDDVIQSKREGRKGKVTSTDGEDEFAHENRANRRMNRSVVHISSESSGDDEADNDDIGNLHQNPCTDLVLYSGVQITTSPDAYIAGGPPSPPMPTQREDVDGPTDIQTTEAIRPTSESNRTRTKSLGSKNPHYGARRQRKEREAEEKYKSALRYQEDADGAASSLTADSIRRANKTSSRSTKGSESKRESASRPPAASRSNSMDPDDMTLFVKGSGILTVGSAQLAIKDGEEITIRTKGRDNTSSFLKGENKGILKNANPTTSHDTITRDVSSPPPAAQPLHGKELDDLYESVRSIGIVEQETPAQRKARREREEIIEFEDRDDRSHPLSTHDWRSSLEIPSRRSTGISEEGPRDGREARAERLRDQPVRNPSKAVSSPGVVLMQEQKSALETSQAQIHEQAGQLTQEPQGIYQPDQTSPNAMRNSDDYRGRPRLHRSESRNEDELPSREQNEKIANRPARPASTVAYRSPRSYIYDPTGFHDTWEQSNGRRTPRANSRVFEESRPGDHTISRVSTRARSRPSSVQDLDGIRPVSRRTSRLDYTPPPPPPLMERLQSPTKRQSLIIDADGRPQPVRTKSENLRSRPGDAGSVPYIVIRRGSSADGRRAKPEMPAAVARSGPRPQSMTDVSTRHHPVGPDPGVTERLPAESWEKETEGVWRKRKAVSILHEDPEEEEEGELSPPQPQTKEGGGSTLQASLDPEQGICRKSTVTDPEPNEE